MEDQKKILKEALKEWLDEKLIQFGKWSFGAFSAALIFALIYFMLTMNGWHR